VGTSGDRLKIRVLDGFCIAKENPWAPLAKNSGSTVAAWGEVDSRDAMMWQGTGGWTSIGSLSYSQLS